MKKKVNSGEERRRARRTNIQESFQLFLAVPEVLGMVRIYLRDISSLGLCFRTEVELGLKKDQLLHVQLYLNPSYYFPLACKVIRAGASETAVEFLKPESPAAKAIGTLQDFFSAAESAAVFVE